MAGKRKEDSDIELAQANNNADIQQNIQAKMVEAVALQKNQNASEKRSPSLGSRIWSVFQPTIAPKNPSRSAGKQFWGAIKSAAKGLFNLAKTAKSTVLTAFAGCKTLLVDLPRLGFHEYKKQEAQKKKQKVVEQAYQVLADKDAEIAWNDAEWMAHEGANAAVDAAKTTGHALNFVANAAGTVLYTTEAIGYGLATGAVEEIPGGMLEFAQGFGSEVYKDTLSVLPENQAKALENIRAYYFGKAAPAQSASKPEPLKFAANDVAGAPSKGMLIHFDAFSNAASNKVKANELSPASSQNAGLKV